MQRWILERCWLLLSLLSTAYARPQYIMRMLPHTFASAQTLTFVAAMQGVQTGPYQILNCGDNTAAVSILIRTLNRTLQLVLDDVSRHTSSDAYNTFFKNIAFAPTVYDILSNITAGTPFPPGPHAIKGASSHLFGSPVTPQFVCVTDYRQITWSLEAGGWGGQQLDAFTACEESPIQSFSVFGSKFLRNTIVLCDAFWRYPAIPLSSESTCLRVDPHFNRFRDTGVRLINYQLWVILSELAHSYIYARSGSLIDVRNANDCMSLAASSAVYSARNYVFYAASESVFVSSGLFYGLSV